MAIKIAPEVKALAKKNRIKLLVAGDGDTVMAVDIDTDKDLALGDKPSEVLTRAIKIRQDNVAESVNDIINKPNSKRTRKAVEVTAEYLQKHVRVTETATAEPVATTTPAPSPEPTNDLDDMELGEARSGIVKLKYKEQYAQTGGTNGDKLADALRKAIHTPISEKSKRTRVNTAALAAIAQANDVDLTPWQGLNLGQVMMNLSNKLRFNVKSGKAVNILGKSITFLG